MLLIYDRFGGKKTKETEQIRRRKKKYTQHGDTFTRRVRLFDFLGWFFLSFSCSITAKVRFCNRIHNWKRISWICVWCGSNKSNGIYSDALGRRTEKMIENKNITTMCGSESRSIPWWTLISRRHKFTTTNQIVPKSNIVSSYQLDEPLQTNNMYKTINIHPKGLSMAILTSPRRVYSNRRSANVNMCRIRACI